MRSGGPGQAQGGGQFLEGGEGLALVGQPAGLLAGEGLGGVALGEDRQLPLLPALGEPRWTGPPRRSPRKVSRSGGLRDRARQVDLARDRRRPDVVLLEEAGQDLLVRGVADRVQEVHVPADELAVAQDEQLDGGLVVLAGHADEVQFGLRERLHLLALHRPLDGPDLVAQGAGALVLGPLGGGATSRPRAP